MAENVVFLGGLPRAGSTLIANVLAQNPRFEVTPTSPLLDYIEAMSRAYTSSPQRRAYLDQDKARGSFLSACMGAINGYFARPVGIDKSRGWTGRCDLLKQIYGEDFKLIVPIRDLRGCVVSEELQYRKHPEFAWDGPMLDLEGRVGHWLNSVPLGPAAVQIKEAIRTRHAEQFLFVKMENFCRNPKEELRRIYEYIGEQWFEHNLKDIQVTPKEHDGIHAPLGNHTLISSEIKTVQERWNEVLGNNLSRQIVNENLWYYQALYPERLA